jgi:hypothetical protein
MTLSLISLHQRNMDSVLLTLRSTTSLVRVYDEDMPPDWDTKPRPCAWLSEEGYDPGDKEGFTSHFLCEVPFTVTIAFGYSSTEPSRALNIMGRKYLAELQAALATLQSDPTLFDIRERTSIFGATTETDVGGLTSRWTICFTRPRLDPYAADI